MTRRSRSLAYGGAGALIVAGVLCAAFIGGGAGPLVAVALVGLGLIAVISLVFLEVGLSEDRWRAGEDRLRARDDRAGTAGVERQRRGTGPAGLPANRSSVRRPPRLERRRGGRRRLR